MELILPVALAILTAVGFTVVAVILKNHDEEMEAVYKRLRKLERLDSA